jgi:hypothetical protein
MTTKHKILVVSGATILAGAIRLVFEILQNSLIDLSARNGFGFGFAGLGYVFFPVYFAILGFILSFVLLNISSFKLSFLISIFFSIYTSIGHIQGLYEIIKRTDYFDKTYFQMDIFQICANFIIFPLIAFFVWKTKNYFASNIKIHG